MRNFAWSNAFRRAFRKRARNDQILQTRIFETLDRLATDPFDSRLRSHKLSGQLEGLWSCWADYDCRIVFTFETDPQSEEEQILLIDIGSHDEVY